MFNCNITSDSIQETQQPLSYLFYFPCFGVVGNSFLFLIIWKTPTISGSTRTLLLNEHTACLLQNVFWVVYQLCGYLGSSYGVLLTMFTLSDTAGNLCFLLMFSTSVNLYLAICELQRYKFIVRPRRVVALVVCLWLLCCSTGVVPILDASSYSYDCEYKIFKPMLTLPALTRLTVFLLEGLAIWISSSYFLFKVLSVRKRVSARSEAAKKFKLAIFICSLSIFLSATLVIAKVTVSTLNYFRENVRVEKPQIYISNVLNITGANLRVCYYLLLYRPMWKTMKTFFLCANNRIKNVPDSLNTQQRGTVSASANVGEHPYL